MTLPFALVLPILFRAQRQPFAAHAVFALHAYTFLLLVFCVNHGIAEADRLAGGAGLESALIDNVLSLAGLAACVAWLFVAIGRFYAASGFGRVLRAAVLTVLVAAIVLGYRLAIFVITLYTTT